jgi:hypothetical protein
MTRRGGRLTLYSRLKKSRNIRGESRRYYTLIPTRLPVKLLGAVSLCRTCKGYGVSFATRSTV